MTDLTTQLGGKFSRISIGTEEREIADEDDDITPEAEQTDRNDKNEDTSVKNASSNLLDNKEKVGKGDQISESEPRRDYSYRKENKGPFMEDWDNFESGENHHVDFEDTTGGEVADLEDTKEEDFHLDETLMRSAVNLDGSNADDTMKEDGEDGETAEKDLVNKYKDVFDGKTATEDEAINKINPEEGDHRKDSP